MPETARSDALRGVDEILGAIGIDVGANDRTKQLAVRGRIAELEELIVVELGKTQPKRGAPKKPLTIDDVRAAKILGLAELLHELGFKPQSLSSLVRFATQVEAHLLGLGLVQKRFFPNNFGPRVRNSVQAGLKSMGADMQMYRKNPVDFFEQCKIVRQ